ncbi:MULTISPECIES: TetR/AcrR family transcriptional regulator [Kitasatospora]|uniref:TetR/AcrR family transcriptional regulator n=1 Tax=Kitasatospora cathayae TaxID=3004092 RepID=A0ABY7QBL8_9ACTN|nr:TetR/AcrR family transcriptional regulator [Kitasatospora sp. HUAS 3-15]WBP90016.1 TetR/AcrR family transcriptional regulator [Kitasatospora sp. HUAS 3-15]
MTVRERADAAHNRRKILVTAQQLFQDSGVDHVSMDDIAEAAGVGKGTLFRRFGNREGLIGALFQQLTEDWQQQALDQLADPGEDPRERVLGFVASLFDDIVVPGRPLLRALERDSGGSHANLERYLLWQGRLARAIAEARPDADADFLAHAILGVLRADFVDLLVGTGMGIDAVRTGVLTLTASILTAAPETG